MPHHVIVDGSNLATEGRTLPSLKQLNEAIASYRGDHPEALITVVVDATFGHRIDSKEVPEFEKAIETNAFVAPPAGAVGRGDGFILSIAQKANASILSNDSYQEFHGEYAWLFDEGRLIGGKPVPYVGWVFVNRVPVRGPISRRSVKEQKVVDKSPGRGRGRKSATDATAAGAGGSVSASSASAASISADGPMPIPKSPPPGSVMAGQRRDARGPAVPKDSADATASSRNNDDRQSSAAQRSTNDLLTFLSFVEHYPVGTAVTAVVETYSSHGAYVSIGDAKGYVPLRSMADPAPRSAREVMAIGETVTLVVSSFGAAKRSIDLAVPAMGPAPAPVAATKTRKRASKKADTVGQVRAATAEVAAEAIAAVALELSAEVSPSDDRPPKAAPRRGRRTAAARPVAEPARDNVSAPMSAPSAETNAVIGEEEAPAPPQPKQRRARASAGEPAAREVTAVSFDSVFDDDEEVVSGAPQPRAQPPVKRASGRRAPAPPVWVPPVDEVAPSDVGSAPAPKKAQRARKESPIAASRPVAVPSESSPAPQPPATARTGRASSKPVAKKPAAKKSAATQPNTPSGQSSPTSTGDVGSAVGGRRPTTASGGRARPKKAPGGG